MKKSGKILFAVVVTAVAMLFASCEKNKGTGNGGDNIFAGTYHMPSKPCYSDMQAKDPSAMAIELELNETEVKLTYMQLIAAVFSMVSTADTGADSEVTFNADGTVKIVVNYPEGPETVLPDESEGIPADGITYALDGNDIVFTLGSSIMDIMIDMEQDPEYVAAIKQILSKFNKGIFIYSSSENTAKITSRYKLSGRELTFYIDKALVTETWSAGKGAVDEIAKMVGEVDPATAAVITSIVPKVDAMLDGFTKLEAGVKLTGK